MNSTENSAAHLPAERVIADRRRRGRPAGSATTPIGGLIPGFLRRPVPARLAGDGGFLWATGDARRASSRAPPVSVSSAWEVARYRLPGTLRRHWVGYLALVLLVGLVGGVAMASFQAARRTQSAYPTFLASTNASDLDVSVYAAGGTAVRDLSKAIEHLRDVAHMETAYIPHIVPLSPDGAARVSVLADLNFVASQDGLFQRIDRLAVTAGRLADPKRIDEMVLDANAARLLAVHVGSVISMGVFTQAQGNSPGFGTPKVQPVERIAMHVSGIIVENTSVVEDDVDRAYGFGFLTPALLHNVLKVAPAGDDTPYYYALQLKGGASDVPTVEGEVRHILPVGAISEFHVASREVTTVELAVRPMSIALAGFGVVAALACLVLGMQAISRLLRDGEEDRRVLRFLGASAFATVADALVGIGIAITAGVAAAIGTAILLSPISPIGPVRPVYPDRGIALDWDVYAIAAAVLIAVLASCTAVQARRSTVHRTNAPVPRPSSVAKGAEAAGMPVTCVVGLRFALESGTDRNSVPFGPLCSGRSSP